MNEEEPEILKIVEFAFSENNYQKGIELIDNYFTRSEPTKQLLLMRAKACIQRSKPHQCLIDIHKSIQLGAQINQYALLKIQAQLECNNTQNAQQTIQHYTSDKPQIQTILKFQKAIGLLEDKHNFHGLSANEEIMFLEMKDKLYKAGAQFDGLKVMNLEKDYRGVIATKRFHKKSAIVYVPKSEIMTLQLAKINRHSKKLLQKEVKLLSPKHTFMSILLLEERSNIQSRWRLYIDSLPTDHSSFPINYTVEELELLEGSPFLFMIHEKAMDLKRDFTLILKHSPEFEKYTFKDFCWARMMVGSRIFGVEISGVKTQILVPFADMLNHKLPKQTTWNYSDAMNGFVIQSLEQIEIGEEVFDSYGRKCNSRFLLNYGFVLHSNKDNQIALRIGMNEETVLMEQKMGMIEMPMNMQYVMVMKTSKNMNVNKFYDLMGLLRFINVDTEEELSLLRKISMIDVKKQAYKPVRTPPISIKTEIKTWQYFLKLCREADALYTTSFEEDSQLLKQALTQNIRNIITLRMGEKQVLHYFIRIGQEIIKILTSQNILEQLEICKEQPYLKYLIKILSVTPGINKKTLNDKVQLLTPEPLDQDPDIGEEQIND